ncbi:hypothetical protein CS0771_53080 [Catellatospora sp. IY07-71]|uniref:tetratricopeptide repeat protein n=1 Tax=Catellatospora sp. IY07-71 TaxID=2728827 RepID=UPI001BB377ED|nr:tetratricopeptide repeat protein [Catellatospora sp. IY07-71]BCJ75764.1 hypothetical protein CS0771_53080 [Catellatospora sp. IY07-71]
MTPASTPVEAAFALLQQGRPGDAEDLMTRELDAAAAAHGHGSAAWASAQCDLGNVLLNADQTARAIECYRSATEATKADPQHRRNHLTYRMNLGMALRMAGRLDEAEAELRQCAQDRGVFYGRGHAGYAFGLEPLAEVLLRRGDLRQAQQVAEQAMDNFWRNGHERLATTLALRAEIVGAGGTGPLFPDLRQLPDGIVELLARSAVDRTDEGDPAVHQTVLTGLSAALEKRLGPDHQATLDTLSRLANLGRHSGEQAGRVEAIQRVLASHDRQGNAEQAVIAMLGLAVAQAETGDEAAVLDTYASAYARAERIGNPELLSQVLRNWGVALRAAGRADQAEQRLAEAVAQAGQGADRELLGVAGVALGCFLQHAGRLAEARTVLEQGLSELDGVHPDAIMGRSHLTALTDGRTCGCDDLESTVTEAFREFVLGRLPAGLLAELDVAIEDGDFQIKIGLQREPTEDELQRLNGVVQSALAEFRRRIKSPR